MIRVISITKSSVMISNQGLSMVPSTSLITTREEKILEQYRLCHILLVTTINDDPPLPLFFYLLDFFVSLFSSEMSHHQKMKTSTYFLFCTQSLFSCHTKREVEIVESEREGVYCVSKWNKPRKGVALRTRMYPQKAMIRKFLGLKVICALTNWIATTMLMDFLLRIISSDMSLLKEVVRITITFNSRCPRATFEKLRQRVDLKIFHRYINWHIFLNMWLLLKKVKSLQPEERMILRNSISCYCLHL